MQSDGNIANEHPRTGAYLVPALPLGLCRSLCLLNATYLIASCRKPLDCLLNAALGATHLSDEPVSKTCTQSSHVHTAGQQAGGARPT